MYERTSVHNITLSISIHIAFDKLYSMASPIGQYLRGSLVIY